MVAADDAAVARDTGEMTLIEHLTELRSRIIRSVIAVAGGAVLCLIFANRIIDALVEPYCRALGELPEGSEERLITEENCTCLLYTSPSPRDGLLSRMPSSA